MTIQNQPRRGFACPNGVTFNWNARAKTGQTKRPDTARKLGLALRGSCNGTAAHAQMP